MKTNQNLIRPMGGFQVTQRTSDGMFSATELLKQWNSTSGNDKRMNDFIDTKSTKEFIQALKSNAEKTALVDNQIITKTRGIKGCTWMHPYLFIDFAMWLNPTFKVQVLKFVYDELIKYRNEAGDSYREMSEAIAKISKKGEIPQNISKVAEAINHIAYGQHAKMIRNHADENQMKDYVRLQKEVAMLIKKGFITSYTSLIDYLRNEWKIKYQPAILQ